MKLRLLILDLMAASLLIGCAGISSSMRSSDGNPNGNGSGNSTRSVDLWWNASASADISGYNIYRADYSNACGILRRINSELVTTTAYTDTTVASGASYCYATTAVNSNDQESGYSNVVTDVQIPAD